MNNELTPTEAILWAYINKELATESRLIEYIVNQNMRDLVTTNSIQETEDYRRILQDLFSKYQSNASNNNETANVISDNVLEAPQLEQNYITLQNERAFGISRSNILHYEFREDGQVIFSTVSAQTLYKDILEYLVAKGHTSIIGNRYIPMPTMEKWYEMIGNSTDRYIQDKYKPFGKNHMLFISITPANIMRKLTYIFNDLQIDLDDLRIYLKEHILREHTYMNTIISKSPSVTTDKPDLVYNPNDETSFYRHELQFKRDLLMYKRARKITYKTDGTIDDQVWNANNFSPTSDLKANITTNNKIREYKRDRILDRIEFFIIR